MRDGTGSTLLVKARLFASFRETVGATAVELQLGPEATVRDLLAALRREHPALGTALDSAMVAVNLEYVDQEHRLVEGDEVAIIPPVSGGGLG